MVKSAEIQSPKGSPIRCHSCGGSEFNRSMSEEGATVRLYLGLGITEEVVHEGEAEFSYYCKSCGQEFTGDEPSRGRA